MDKIQITTVNNNETLYYAVATWLLSGKSLLVHWTDNEGTIYDILFSLPFPVGIPAEGLVIGVIGYNTIIIPVDSEVLHHSYFAEKMNYPKNTTLIKLTELFNEVKKLLCQKI